MFIVLLVLLYVMSTNAIVVPLGCFITAWVFAVMQVLGGISSALGGIKNEN